MTSVDQDPFTDVIGYFYLAVSVSDAIQCSVHKPLVANIKSIFNWAVQIHCDLLLLAIKKEVCKLLGLAYHWGYF